MSVSVCECVGVCEWVSVWMLVCVSECGCVGVSECGCVSVRVCECVGGWAGLCATECRITWQSTAHYADIINVVIGHGIAGFLR